jgi:hypothetical protein
MFMNSASSIFAAVCKFDSLLQVHTPTVEPNSVLVWKTKTAKCMVSLSSKFVLSEYWCYEKVEHSFGKLRVAYHVVFDDTWSTVPFMKAATLPPNWEDLVKNSKEIATIEEFELADDWIKKNEAPNEMQKRIMDRLPAQDSSSRITDPFAVVQGQQQQDGELSPASATHSTDELALECSLPGERMRNRPNE